MKLSIFNEDDTIDLTKSNDQIQSYENDEAYYWIEDMTGKIVVKFAQHLQNNLLTTGYVLGFSEMEENGIFYCNRLIFPVPLEGSCRNVQNPRKILIFSNPLINRYFAKLIPILDAFIDQIDDILIMGNVFDTKLDDWDFSRFVRIVDRLKGNFYTVPGKTDPTTSTVPQQPFHKKLFSDSEKFIHLPNPGSFMIDGVQMVSIDHNLITKDMRYKRECEPLDALEYINRCRHMCPCSPDTIPSIPLSTDDPFILSEGSFFIAGGEKAQHTIYGDKFLIEVPDFSETNTGILLDMKELTLQEIQYE